MKIKIYGERNSGTNYLEKLIESNLKVALIKFRINWWSLFLLKTIPYDFVQDLIYRLQRKKTLGWKHGCPSIREIESYNSNTLVIITITKNPYSFLSSLYKKPYHIKGKKPESLARFITQKWTTRKRDLCNKKHLESPIFLWNIKNKAYLNLKNKVSKKVINITYEELLENPELCIQNIASKGNIEFVADKFQNHLTSTKDSKLTFDNYKEYYLKEKWENDFSKNDFAYINTKVDQELMACFNYKKHT